MARLIGGFVVGVIAMYFVVWHWWGPKEAERFYRSGCMHGFEMGKPGRDDRLVLCDRALRVIFH